MKILFLTDIPPCKNYTAGLVINSWCDFLLEEGHEICCALVQDQSLNPDIPSDKINKIKFLEIQKPRENWGLPETVKLKDIRENLRSFLNNNLISLIELPQIASRISKFAKENDCQLILVSIQGQTITKLVRKVAKKTKLEYVAQTWDPLEWWMKEYKFDPITRCLNLQEFKRVVKEAKNFMAMSWAMSVEFERKYGVKCVTNIPGLRGGKIRSGVDKNKGKFIISFAGQLYAKDEFDTLIEALERINWTHNGQEIIINLYGSYFDEKYHHIEGVNIKGYIEQEKLLGLLSSSDLLYCPYWFSKEFEKVCKLSFPAKLVSFLRTGVPVLMHAPEYASPRILLEKSKAAYICNSLNVSDMVNVLQRVLDDKNREKIGLKGYELFEKYMTYKVMKKSLFVSLGLMDEKEIEELESVREIYL